MLFSLAPLAIVLVAIVGVVLQDDSLRTRVIHDIVDALPLSDQGGDDVTQAIEKIAKPVNVLGVISLFVFGWAASGMMGAIRTGLEVAMRVENTRPAARAKLVDLILVVGAAALVLGTVLVNIVVQVATNAVERWLAEVGLSSDILQVTARHGLPLLLSTVVVLLLYRFVPARRLRFADALAGAIFTALLLLAISLGSGWLYGRTSNLSVVYGVAHGCTRLPLFRLPLCIGPSARRRGGGGVVASRPGDGRAVRRQDPPALVRPLRPPGSTAASQAAATQLRVIRPADACTTRRSLRRPRSPPTTTLGLRTTRAGNPVAEPAARAPPAGRREARSRR